ncbi:MAG TPA: S16 family serine protease [Actinomycetota bacterium]|nr:S16 family serine protease [Actinomycetota bacterium]
MRPLRIALLVLAAAVLYVGGYVFLPYYSIGPGPARDVEPLIRVDGAPRYPSDGRFVLTSVVFSQLTGFGLIGAWLDPDRAVVKRERVYPSGETVEVERQRAISQMDQSKLDATSVVLRELTDYPKDHGEGVLVESVVNDCAADGELYPGDLILRIDGETVNNRNAASRAIESAESGSVLTFDVTVDGEPETVDLVREPCGGQKDPLVGVSLINAFPIDVSISSGAIGGPSAGLMWALGLYDLLTPGDLTGGRTIAGTGMILLDGTVYPIGGIGEKLTAAEDAGAEVFFVPKENLEEARASGDHDLELVVVETFDDAIRYLEGRD